MQEKNKKLEAMNSETIYSRKISKTEAQNGFIFVLKNKLSFFPPIGDEFKMASNDLTYTDAKVESCPCTCRGSERPHEHYFVRWKGLKAGDTIKIVRSPGNDAEYLLQIEANYNKNI